jgi:hypothetical protein
MTQISISSKSLPALDSSCCAPSPATGIDSQLHTDLAELLRRYNVNEYAASVRVFAVKQS